MYTCPYIHALIWEGLYAFPLSIFKRGHYLEVVESCANEFIYMRHHKPLTGQTRFSSVGNDGSRKNLR